MEGFTVFLVKEGACFGDGKRDGLHGAVRCQRHRQGDRFCADGKSRCDDALPVAVSRFGAHNQRGLVTVPGAVAQGHLDRGFD